MVFAQLYSVQNNKYEIKFCIYEYNYNFILTC